MASKLTGANMRGGKLPLVAKLSIVGEDPRRPVVHLASGKEIVRYRFAAKTCQFAHSQLSD